MRRATMQEMIPKSRAVSMAMIDTGFGRRVVENKMDELLGQGRIRIVPSPADKRLQLISRDDLNLIIAALKGEA